MIKLEIKNFSCLEDVTINVDYLTVLIGEQGAGKSLILKLVHLFSNCVSSALNNRDFIFGEKLQFPKYFKEEFIENFPALTWGKKPFVINYYINEELMLSCKRDAAKQSGTSLKIEIIGLKKYFNKLNKKFQKIHMEIGQASSHSDERKTNKYKRMKDFRQARDDIIKEISVDLNYKFSDSYFIPAGRAYFSSMGKLVSVLKSDRDPITKEFADIWAASVDVYGSIYKEDNFGDAKGGKSLIPSEIKKLIGGEVKFTKDYFYIESEDGRSLNPSYLSSGQQELLPLYFVSTILSGNDEKFIFIEEPEAHLFPHAQKTITNYILSKFNMKRTKSLCMSTHSPYILTTLNNVLLGSKLYSQTNDPELKAKIEQILLKDSILNPTQVNVYAIQNGRAISLIGDDGLIDGSYIDEISNNIMADFDDLLEIENLMGKQNDI